MRIYKDESLINEIKDYIIELGRLEAGETKQYSFYVFNDSNAVLENLKFEIEHPEIKLISAPKELSSQASDELIIEWSPSIDIEEGLRVQIKITGTRVWSP